MTRHEDDVLRRLSAMSRWLWMKIENRHEVGPGVFCCFSTVEKDIVRILPVDLDLPEAVAHVA
jgi:hypothetical protein